MPQFSRENGVYPPHMQPEAPMDPSNEEKGGAEARIVFTSRETKGTCPRQKNLPGVSVKQEFKSDSSRTEQKQ
jgi:hypothetical protein